MNGLLPTRGSRLALALVGLLLVGAAVMDFAVTSPRIARKHQLEVERDRLRADLARTLGAKFRDVDAASALNAPDLAAAIAAPAEDPVTFLGRLTDAHGLTGITLNRLKTRESANLTSTEFNVLANGRYDQLLEFVSELEGGERLAMIDDLVLTAGKGRDVVEGRFHLTIHDPKER